MNIVRDLRLVDCSKKVSNFQLLSYLSVKIIKMDYLVASNLTSFERELRMQ